jgi:hypothetical protein
MIDTGMPVNKGISIHIQEVISVDIFIRDSGNGVFKYYFLHSDK